MRSYLALMRIDLKLALRNKSVLFFNYLFPLVFFFAFTELMDAEGPESISYVVSMVLVLGILGNGLFGAGMRAVQERQMNILRRFKVAPISALPLLVASMVTGWLVYIPAVVIIMALAFYFYGMPLPQNLLSLFALISLGVLTFRAMGLILASVANSMQESNILIQLFYMPMLFLSGATFPLAVLPLWAQITAQFLPASYLVTGFQGVFFRREGLLENWASIAALILATVLALFISVQIFRWDSEEKIRPAAKLWVLAILVPFIFMGVYQAYSRESIEKAKSVFRDIQADPTVLIHGARLFIGDGSVVEPGGVLIREGKIAEVYRGEIPQSAFAGAEIIDAAGKTLLPGLMDAQVHLGAPDSSSEEAMEQALAADLYHGITAVRSTGEFLAEALEMRSRIQSGSLLGAELFVSGPLFDELPQTTEDARRRVRDLGHSGVDAIAVDLERLAGLALNPLSLQAVIEEAHNQQLPVVVHTQDSATLRAAVEAGADAIDHVASGVSLPQEIFLEMTRRGIAYQGTQDLFQAYLAGVMLVMGSDAGRPAVLDGPTLHDELLLWVQAGIPSRVALQAATYNAARLLRADHRIGLIREGYQANLLLVDGNPVSEITAIRQISAVIYQGRVVNRERLIQRAE
ncbi:MAG: amidohydrolase family protein [Acidobacteriota bacterium]